MQRLFYSVAMLSVLMFACNIPSISTQPTATLPPKATNPPVVSSVTPEATNIPVAIESPTPVTNTTCNELSLYLDPALASGFNCETIPESTDVMEITPQYTKIIFQGYVLSDKFFDAHISIFPVQRYTELLPDFIPGDVTNLHVLISSGAFSGPLPFLPTFNAAQVFHAQYQVVPFVSGGGIRFITLYAQYFAPINNHDLFYTYQGLTSDGFYWVSAILPINNPILPANGDNPPGGLSWDEFNSNYEPYLTDMTNQLNSQTSDSYTPTLAALDALVASITIQP